MRVQIILVVMIASGCASMPKSITLGVGTGAALGTAGGFIYEDENKKQNATKGAMVGAAVGGITSYLLHKGVKKREARIRRDTIFNLDRHGVSTPPGFKVNRNHDLSLPIVESEIVDERISKDGKHLIESHRVWKVKEDSRFTPSPLKERFKYER